MADQQWEYAEVVKLDGSWHPVVPGHLPDGDSTAGLASTLNEVGRGGWDFVAMAGDDVALVRRPRADDSDPKAPRRIR